MYVLKWELQIYKFQLTGFYLFIVDDPMDLIPVCTYFTLFYCDFKILVFYLIKLLYCIVLYCPSKHL